MFEMIFVIASDVVSMSATSRSPGSSIEASTNGHQLRPLMMRGLSSRVALRGMKKVTWVCRRCHMGGMSWSPSKISNVVLARGETVDEALEKAKKGSGSVEITL